MSWKISLVLSVLSPFTTRLIFLVFISFLFLLWLFFVLSFSFLARSSGLESNWAVLVPAGVAHSDPQTTDVWVCFPVRPTHWSVHYFAILPPGTRLWGSGCPTRSVIFQAERAPLILGQCALSDGKIAAVFVRFLVRTANGAFFGRALLGT